jgi:hypothetical protein
MTSWQPALLIRPATTPSPADMGYYIRYIGGRIYNKKE